MSARKCNGAAGRGRAGWRGLVAAGLVLLTGCATPTPAPRHVRIFAYGNSFTYNATLYLPDLVKAAPYGDTLRIETVWLPGASLEWLWNAIEIFEDERAAGATQHVCRKDKPCGSCGHGRPGDKGVSEWLAGETWDYVTLQQYSQLSARPESYQPYLANLCAYIRKHAPGAEIVLHETWAYRADDPYHAKHKTTEAGMYRGLRQAYEGAAAECRLRLLPVGDAFWAAYHETPAWRGAFPDPGFDYQAGFVYPALPDQARSLHQGYRWSQDPKSQAWRLGADMRHAGPAGSYLAGCVWYEFFFRRSVLGNSFHPPEVSAADAAILQRIAHRIVSEGWRPPLPPPHAPIQEKHP